jgi:hypothetical protein
VCVCVRLCVYVWVCEATLKSEREGMSYASFVCAFFVRYCVPLLVYQSSRVRAYSLQREQERQKCLLSQTHWLSAPPHRTVLDPFANVNDTLVSGPWAC